jgi:hypothetical protein
VKKDPADQKNKEKGAKAWIAGDTVLVVGSKRMSSNTAESEATGDERVFWEYTPKAIRLVAAYKSAFPNLFAALAKAPDERFYDAMKVFGPKGEEMCGKVLDWIKAAETSAMPRLPPTTEAMPVAAVHAVQRAADVRTSTIEKDITESNVKIPSAALYKEASTAATDILLASEHSVSAPPELGDRVANLCASGVPFGARGTVVAVHDPAEGCVEVVMDEEFIGGSTLQGSCSNFRGKLCVWNHLLKISAADSKGVVDEMLPTGAGKAAVNQLMSDIKVAEPISQKQGASVGEPGRDPTNPWGSSPPRSASAPRSGSAPRGKRSTWREALGPPETIVGFTKYRKTESGYDEWKKIVARNERIAQEAKSKGLLKAASADLKSLLGVTSQIPPPLPPKPSAADTFVQMMMKDIQSMPPPPQRMPMPQASRPAFNFSYVKEGEEEKTVILPPPLMMNPMVTMPAYMMPPQMIPPYGMMMNQGPPSQVAGNGAPLMANTATTETAAKKSMPMVPSVVVKSKK